jgi:DNA-binding GntR family transcriptional regulator
MPTREGEDAGHEKNLSAYRNAVPESIPRVVLEELAYKKIIGMILENKFAPGDALLETDISIRLGLSRTPISHALGRLVSEGFLQKRKKKGCVIPVPNGEDAKQVFYARATVESQAAAATAKNATPADLARLSSILDEQEKAHRDGNKELYTQANQAFHMEIYQLAKNIYLERYCRNALWHSNSYIFFFDRLYQRWGDPTVGHRTAPQHRDILKAMVQHDAEAAARLMKDHIDGSYNDLFKNWG